MADTFNMSDVFISYSRRNSEFVHKLYNAFKALDKEVWVDFEDIPLTADWWKEIQAGIDAAETFIFVLTPDSVRSEICRDEIEHAVKTNKRIVPILHQDILEDDDKKKIHEVVSSHNWIFFRETDDFDSAFNTLMGAVETDLDHNRVHTRLLVRAKEWEDNNKGKSYLLRDEDLRQAETWFTQAVNKSPTPTNLHADYISASRMAQTSRQRNALIGVTIALGIAIALTIFSIFQWRDAQVAREQAEVAREQAEQAAIRARSLTLSAYTQDALSDNKPDLALRLALEAVRVDNDQPQVLKSLREAAYAPGTRLLIPDHAGFVLDVDFDNRGGLILSGASDRTACISQARDGERLMCLGEDGGTAHNANVNAVEFFDNEQRALTADVSGMVKMWDTNPQSPDFGTEILSYQAEQGVLSFRIMPDEASVLLGLNNGEIHHWYIDSGEVIPFAISHTAAVNSIEISSDGTFAMTASDDERVGVWDIETGQALAMLEGHTDDALSVAISEDGTQAISGGQDNSFILWNLEDYSLTYIIQAHESGIADIAFGPKPTQITTASWDNSIRIWNIYTRRMLYEYHGHTGGINRIDIDEGGNFIVSGSFDTDMRLWETRIFTEVGFVEGDGSGIQYLDYSPDGNFVATAHDSHDVLLWDVNQRYSYMKTLTGHTGRVVSIAVSPDSEKVASISDDNRLIVWDWDDEEELLNIEDISTRIYMVLFGNSDDYVYVALKESLRWYDIDSGEQLGEIFYDGEIGGNNSLSISPDGTMLLAGLRGSSDNLYLIDLESGEVVLELDGHTDGVLTTAFAADGKVGVSGSWDNSVRVWDLETGDRTYTFSSHSERITSVDITDDGRFVISGSNDRSMHLWDLSTGTDELEYIGHTDRIQVARFHPNQREMITGSIDTTGVVWRFPHPLDELQGWIEMNRYVKDLNCTERNVYEIEPYCTEDEE